jgi:release factor glutamine methyltransferase
MIIKNIIEQKLVSKITNQTVQIGTLVNLTATQLEELKDYQTKIDNMYPLDYIIGYIDILGVRVFTPEGVFIPRPCTEELIDICQQYIKAGSTVLDVCAGSGIIGLILANNNPSIDFVLIEQSHAAIDSINKSILYNHINNIKLIHSDALELDYSNYNNYCIICNPPYVPESDIYDSVRHEPKEAIYSGGDGLTFFNKFIRLWSSNLPNQIMFELDSSNIHQAQANIQSYYNCKIINDGDEFPRFLIGTK